MPGAIDDSWSNMDDMGEEEARDATWGGDLMDVNEDQGDWDEFECAPAPVLSTKKTVPKKTGGKTLKLGGASSKIRIPLGTTLSPRAAVADLEQTWTHRTTGTLKRTGTSQWWHPGLSRSPLLVRSCPPSARRLNPHQQSPSLPRPLLQLRLPLLDLP